LSGISSRNCESQDIWPENPSRILFLQSMGIETINGNGHTKGPDITVFSGGE
jgi:hypothetical protein